MKRSILVMAIILSVANVASADTFGTGDNQFTIDFVNISGDASSANGTNISQYPPGEDGYRTFTDPGNDYRMGTYEITNDQWDRFTNIYGIPTGSDGQYNPGDAYDSGSSIPPDEWGSSWPGTNIPTNELSWYEGAQFVNYLNTSTGHAAAYKFTGTQGTGDYTLGVWESGDADYDSTNPYRNSNAFYFLPTEDEWVKAAYWNGTNLQTYATIDGSHPIPRVDTNFDRIVPAPWDVGSGSEELNGTFDMMGNVWEWFESPFYSGEYLPGSKRGVRGGHYIDYDGITLSNRNYIKGPATEVNRIGFRVASVPEPTTLLLLSLGGLMLRWRR